MAKNSYRSPMETGFKDTTPVEGDSAKHANPLMPSPAPSGGYPPVNFAFDLTATPETERTPFQDALNQQMKQGGAASFKSSPLTSPFEDALAKTFKK